MFAVYLFLSARSFAQTDSIAATKPEKIVTKHNIKIDNKLINYTATVGTVILKNEKEEPVASFGYTAYTKDGEGDMVKDLLHFHTTAGQGLLLFGYTWCNGTKKSSVNDLRQMVRHPIKLEDNNYSILDVSILS
jgi:hypothetical protein